MKANASQPKKILAVDIGGSNVKFLASGESEPRKVASGVGMSPADMVERVRKHTRDWRYSAVSIGYPGLVGSHGPLAEPGNLGPGWVGFVGADRRPQPAAARARRALVQARQDLEPAPRAANVLRPA